MGNIFTMFISLGIDWLSSSLTANIWEWIFNKYDPTTSKVITIIEGLFQLTAEVITSTFILNLITPNNFQKDNTVGLVVVLSFMIMYSPNMRAKLQVTHSTMKQMFLFPDGGFFSRKTKIEAPVLVEPKKE